jgi:hypothetical protein
MRLYVFAAFFGAGVLFETALRLPLSLIPGFASYALLRYILIITHFFANVPYGVFFD